MEHLTTETFKEKVFDYQNNKEWSFNGTKPAIIDYFASWCQPCKRVAPILDELSTEYQDIDFYKINTEEQPELPAAFGIQGIPSILLIPVGKQPQLVVGAQPKETYKLAIQQVIFGEQPEIEINEEKNK